MKKIIRKAIRISIWVAGSGFILSIVITLLYRFIPVPVTPLMLSRYFFDGREINKEWKSLDEISSELPLAVITSEDQKFEEHFGFDMEAIQKAAKYNKKHKGKKVKGASTISQQTAKNVFLWPSRNWIRKGLEVYFTFLIEVCWSKDRIMEVYLNVIEMGPGIYGAEAASHYYFHKQAARLSRNEAAAIAAILPNPIRWSASTPTPYIERKKMWIMRHMNGVKEEMEKEKN